MKKPPLLLAAVATVFMGYADASAQSCPNPLPVPADAQQVQCTVGANSARCGGGLSQALCQENNDRALRNGLITQDAYSWLQSNGYCAVNIDAVKTILAICPVGCFEEGTAILARDDEGAEGWVAAKDVTLRHRLLGLGAGSDLAAPALEARDLERRVHGDEALDLFVFALDNGHTLRVTHEHAMVLADGRVVEARSVGPQDRFIGLDGGEVRIESIGREPTRAEVYNFAVRSNTRSAHVIVAEGVLVGDLTWQNALGAEEASIALRR